MRHIPSVLAIDAVETRSDGSQVLRREQCPQSLAELVTRGGPLSAADAVVLGRTLATALAGMHKAGVVHGGVSPHNVLFRASGEPVLVDGGLVLRHTFPRDPLHAIEFRAPEAARTEVFDEANDMYGLGAVVHFALTGGSPHPGKLGERQGERVLRVLREPVPAIHREDAPVAVRESEAQRDAAGAGGAGFEGGVGEAGVDVRFADVDAVAAGVGDRRLRAVDAHRPARSSPAQNAVRVSMADRGWP
ncbi:hypothetical protein OG570_32880 [Amycolatopsis sp. NBC_01286]|nr:hypothetical protein OG570_32880 [Amycolatopsis sp. NBC_01286]